MEKHFLEYYYSKKNWKKTLNSKITEVINYKNMKNYEDFQFSSPS